MIVVILGLNLFARKKELCFNKDIGIYSNFKLQTLNFGLFL